MARGEGPPAQAKVTKQVIVRRLAEQHLAEASAWYEQQATGLGSNFLDRFEEALAQIARFPESGPIVFLDYRRLLLRRFPYGVFYVLEGNLIVVAAIYHLARHPRIIQENLRP